MAKDPHFQKTVLSMHFDEAGDPLGPSLKLALRGPTNQSSIQTVGTVWTSGALTTTFAGRKCIQLPASSAYYGLYGIATGFLLNVAFTIEAWVYITSTPVPYTGLFAAINGATDASDQLSLHITATGLRFYWGGSYTDFTVTIPKNTWAHFAISCNGTQAAIYVNGVRVGYATKGASGYTHTGVRVGLNSYGGGGIVGYVSDFRVYIANKYNFDTSNFDPTWPMPQLGNQNDTSAVERAVTGTGSAVAPYTAGSKFGGGCLRLDGASYLECAASADWQFGTGDFTVEAWVKRQGSGTWQAIVGQWNNTTDTSWSMHVGTGNDLVFFTRTASTDYYLGTYPVVLPADEWVHCAVSRQGGTLRMFVGGVLAASRADVAGLSFGVTGTVLRVGRAVVTTDWFTGYVDDLRITKGVARYTENFTPPEQTFPDGQASVTGVVRDAEGNPCSRKVFAHSRGNGRLLGTAVSDPVTGVYEIAADETCYVVCLDSTDSYNAKIVDGVDPTA